MITLFQRIQCYTYSMNFNINNLFQVFGDQLYPQEPQKDQCITVVKSWCILWFYLLMEVPNKAEIFKLLDLTDRAAKSQGGPQEKKIWAPCPPFNPWGGTASPPLPPP